MSTSDTVDHIDGGTGAITETVEDVLRRLPIDPRQYGAALDGTTDDGVALKKCFAEASSSARPIRIPKGSTLLFTDADVQSTGVEFVPPSNCVIEGEDWTSVIKFKRTTFPSAYGLSVQDDNLLLRNLTIAVDINGGTGFAAALAITNMMKNLRVYNTQFVGSITPTLGVPTGEYAIKLQYANAEDIFLDRCHFEKLDFGLVKSTDDPSTQSRIHTTDCTAEFVQEVFEFNSPGIFDGIATSGSAIITGIGSTANLSAGMGVRSPVLPVGVSIISIDSSSQISLSANATASGTKRFSAGEINDISVIRLSGKNILQWGIGLANCKNIKIDCNFEDVSYEAVHLEDYTENAWVRVGGKRCNTQSGVPGSSSANNGAVQILTGCSRIDIELVNFDLTHNSSGSPNGVVVQPAGTSGTTGELASNKNIKVSGAIICKSGCQAVIAFEADVHFDLDVYNPDPSSRASPVNTLKSASWSGALRVENPGTLVEVNDASMGAWDALALTGDITNLDWASGFFSADRNAPPIVDGKITFLTESIANSTADWATLCPAPHTFFGRMSRKYVGDEHAYEVGAFEIDARSITPTDVMVSYNSIDLTPGAGTPKQTDDGWRISAGVLQFRAYANPSISCEVRVTLSGIMYPAA